MRFHSVLRAVSALLVLIATACGGGAVGPQTPAATATSPVPTSLAAETGQDFASMTPLTVNIYLGDSEFSPSIVSIPAGRPVQLVMRNRSRQLRGYHVSGLTLVDDVWFVSEGGSSETPEGSSSTTGVDPAAASTLASLDDHEAHHQAAGHLVPRHACEAIRLNCGASSHIQTEVLSGEIVVLMFTAIVPGSFEVADPTNPASSARLIVF